MPNTRKRTLAALISPSDEPAPAPAPAPPMDDAMLAMGAALRKSINAFMDAHPERVGAEPPTLHLVRPERAGEFLGVLNAIKGPMTPEQVAELRALGTEVRSEINTRVAENTAATAPVVDALRKFVAEGPGSARGAVSVRVLAPGASESETAVISSDEHVERVIKALEAIASGGDPARLGAAGAKLSEAGMNLGEALRILARK